MRRENETLKRTLEARKLVERAKGILMQRLGLSEPDAFRRIQKTAMDTRKPMSEVAQALLLTEEMAQSRSKLASLLASSASAPGCLFLRQSGPRRLPRNCLKRLTYG